MHFDGKLPTVAELTDKSMFPTRLGSLAILSLNEKQDT
ncbi:hypothetical protein OKW42_003247 [Paraburkholderia sp. WC7.3d]